VSDSGSDGLVKVSLAVDGETSVSQKAISVDSPSFTFWYKAVPQWSQERPIHGGTNGQFVMIPNCSAGASNPLGYFTAGDWVFYIEVRNGSTPVYQGQSAVTISSSSANITVDVAKIIDHATPGVVKINITAPTINNTDELTIAWGEGAGKSATVSGTPAGSITTFTYTKTELAVGTYTFTFTHNNIASGTSIAVDLNQNQMVIISGSFDSGEWDIRSINLPVHEIEFNISGEGNVWNPITAAVQGDWVAFSLNPEPGLGVSSCSMECDGEPFEEYITNGLQYGFTMPDGEITVNVVFDVVTDVTIDDSRVLRAIISDLYNVTSKTSATKINSANNAKYLADKDIYDVIPVNGLKVWYNSTDKTIYYYAEGTIYLKGSCSGLFSSCLKVEYITLSNIDTTGVTDMSYMFGSDASNTSNPHKLKRITLNNGTNFDTSHVTNMKHMFGLCYQLEHDALDFVKDFNTSNVTDMSYMFAGNLHTYYIPVDTLDLRNWKFEKVQRIDHMFDRCEALNTGLLFPAETNFKSLVSINNAFSQCPALDPDHLRDIVKSWKFSGQADYENKVYGNNNSSLFGPFNGAGQDTTRNYLIRTSMLAGGEYGNFAVRQKYKTADGYYLYIGGANGNNNCCLTVNPGSYVEPEPEP
jgi:surface protein